MGSTGGGGKYRDQHSLPASPGRGQAQECKPGILTTHAGLVFYRKTMMCSIALLALDTTLLITMTCLNSHEAKNTGFKKKNELFGAVAQWQSTSVWKVLVPPPSPTSKEEIQKQIKEILESIRANL